MKNLVIVLLLILGFFSCQGEAETYTVQERTLNEAAYASGEIFPAEYEFLNTASPERVMKILVEEGDAVRAGEVLAVLGTPSENSQLTILTDQVALARQNAQENAAILSEIKDKIQLALVKYHQDSLNADRYRELAQDKAVSEREAEQAKIQAEMSNTEYKSLQKQYQSLKNELYHQVLNAEQELARLKQSREGKMLISNLNGKVYGININEGELAKPDEPILMVGSADKFKLELLVDERDINKIKLAQQVYFETDAFAEKQFNAEVIKIVAVLQKETRSFKVEARVEDEESFYPQSSVEANIMIRENAEVLVIPTEYLLEGDSVNLRSDSEQKVKIISGTRNGDWIEVKEGLKAGDIITKRN